MTSTTNLIRLQSDLNDHVKREYEFRNAWNGTRISTKEITKYSYIKPYLKKNSFHYFILSPNSEKPIKAIIHHLPPDGISSNLDDLGFNVINVRQMTANGTAPNGQTHVKTLTLFLVILTRNINSQEMCKLISLNHIMIKVELYRAQTGLTQCYNCQNFGHVWANCKQPPRCLWYGGNHLHSDCPEKTNTGSTPICFSCTPEEWQKPHPMSYRGCSHMWKEKRKASSQGILWEDILL
jgi:hypothetical protein